jgi:capsule polysaccharide export protein KpsE/RkpR
MPRGDPKLIPPAPAPLSADDLVRLVRGRWLVVLLFGLTGLAATFTFYWKATKWYEAEIMIIPKPDPTGAGLALSLFSSLGLGLSPSHSETDRIASILHSRSVSDGVIATFDLIHRYSTGSIEVTRKQLWSSCSTTVMKLPKVVHLACEDKDPKIARGMLEEFSQLADHGLRRIAISSVREERSFLEGRVAEAERDLNASSRALRRFQETSGILDLSAQGKAAISGLAVLEGGIISRRVELSYTRGFASNREGAVTRLVQEIGAITAELRALEGRRTAPVSSGPPRAKGNIFPPALEVPSLRAELDVLLREQEVRQTLFRFLVGQYETMKAKEKHDLSSFIVFDPAVMPTESIRPTLRILPPGFLASLLLGVLFVSGQSRWRGRRRRRVLVGS